MTAIYTAVTGRRFDLEQLTLDQRSFLAKVGALFRRRPDWDEFAQAWPTIGREMLWRDGADPVGHPIYRICQDLEARLGIAEGRVAETDYVDQLVDLIEVRFGSRYRFCKETGIDQGHLSRVLAGKKHLSIATLFSILEALGTKLAVVDRVGEERGWLDVELDGETVSGPEPCSEDLVPAHHA